ncbi:MAG: porin [Phocaeicola sp.]
MTDAGWLKSNNEKLVGGVALVDMRVGVRANYGPYNAKVDLGYDHNKLSVKDVFMERTFSHSNLLRLGYFIHQFGLQSATSSSMKVSMEEPTLDEEFLNTRLIGAMFMHTSGPFFGTLSVHVENEAFKKNTAETGKQGYGVMSRLVYRPIMQDGKVLHVGISGAFETPCYNADSAYNHKTFVFKTNFPTKIGCVIAQEVDILDARYLLKFSPELCAMYGRFGLEAQYYYLNVKRINAPSYKASGAYGIFRALILGEKYSYSSVDSDIGIPAPKSLECALAYSYSNFSDEKSVIFGGVMQDVSCTFNYYINKRMVCRLRYSYTHVSGQHELGSEWMHGLQTRIQFSF